MPEGPAADPRPAAATQGAPPAAGSAPPSGGWLPAYALFFLGFLALVVASKGSFSPRAALILKIVGALGCVVGFVLASRSQRKGRAKA